MPSGKDPALTCTRCQGFVMTDCEETRCLNCGCRPLDVRREPEDAKRGRRRRCTNCKENAVVWHNYCQRHLDYFVEYGRKKKAQLEQAQLLMRETA